MSPPRNSAADRRRFSELATFAAETAVAVGEAIAIDNVGIVTRKKGRANFATAADHAAEEAIIRAIGRRDPGVPVLAEESARAETRRAERLWVVDPIDGTLNFSRGVPFYCVAIAYVEGGRARAAAVHAPRTRETFVASEGGGATMNGLPIAVSDTVKASEAFVIASLGFRSTARADSRFVALNATAARLRVIGSAVLEICYVAMGRADLFVHEALSPWDIAGPQLIAREGGAAVRSLVTGADAAWDEPQVIIGNAALVKDAIAKMPLIRPVGPRRGSRPPNA